MIIILSCLVIKKLNFELTGDLNVFMNTFPFGLSQDPRKKTFGQLVGHNSILMTDHKYKRRKYHLEVSQFHFTVTKACMEIWQKTLMPYHNSRNK